MNRIGKTTITDTVMRIEVGVCLVTKFCTFAILPDDFTAAASEFAWLI